MQLISSVQWKEIAESILAYDPNEKNPPQKMVQKNIDSNTDYVTKKYDQPKPESSDSSQEPTDYPVVEIGI